MSAGSQGEASYHGGSCSLIHVHPPLPTGAISQQDDGSSPRFHIEHLVTEMNQGQVFVGWWHIHGVTGVKGSSVLHCCKSP